MTTPNQSDLILAHLRDKGPLTPMQALREFRCFRLGARIYDLKRKGHVIATKIIPIGKKHVARYSLVKLARRAA